MLTSNLVFYGIEALVLLSALAVVLSSNPIYSALFLALSMIGVAGIFVTLDAFFLAAIQLTVYAGAVMVLFVMVVMLFNLRKEKKAFSGGRLSFVVKFLSVSAIWYLISTAVLSIFSVITPKDLPKVSTGTEAVKELSSELFIQYVFGFEVISILLLVVIVGSVSLARAKGGTHASRD